MRVLRALVAAGILAIGISATLSASVDREVSTLDFVVAAAGCPHLHGTVVITELSQVTVDRNGGVHATIVGGAHGTATDPDGQDLWHVMDQDLVHDFTGAIGEEFTVVENFRLIGPGTERNITIQVIAHFRVLADGTVAVAFEHDTNLDEVACTGNLPG
jgi:hypothetical protein